MNAFRFVTEQMSDKVKLNGVIIEAPAFGLDDPPMALKVALGRLFAPIIPTLTVDNEVDPEDISRIPKEVERYRKDPMVHRRISLLTAKTLFDYQEWLKESTSIPSSVPLLLCHGTADRITSPSCSEMVFKKIQCPDKSLKLYQDAYHSLHNDIDSEQVLSDWLEWLQLRINE